MSAEAWGIWFFRRLSGGPKDSAVPGVDFLDSCPGAVAQKFAAILHAVVEAPPPRFAGGGQWEVMHGLMKGIYEARTKGPDARFYRLFCVLDRELPGRQGPGLVVLTGMSKPRGTIFSDGEYRAVTRLAAEYWAIEPRSVTRG